MLLPLRKLRLVDDTGSLFKAPTITFDPAELGEEAFGWNFPLGILIPALFKRAQELGVEFTNADAASVHTASDSVTVTTTAGQRRPPKRFCSRSSTGRTISRNVTKLDTGLPGRPMK